MASVALGCGARARPLGDSDRWDRGQCRATYTLESADSPRTELGELGGGPLEAQARFPAAEIDPARMRAVSATADLRLNDRPVAWFGPHMDVVVLDAAAFAPLRRTHPTRVAPGQSAVVGRVTERGRQGLGDRGVLELLLRAEIIETYWQLGADLCLADEQATDGEYRARVLGVHQYTTRTRVERAFAFDVRIDPTGTITTTARDPKW
ncbi:MAG: hypothetical protein AB1Z98_10415 [Nannocystaceae bacterium]